MRPTRRQVHGPNASAEFADPMPDRASDVFATTQWTVVLAAGTSDESKSRDALQRLCETYWHPVYGFVRRKGFCPDDAEELTQEYFARLLSGESLRRVDRSKGKFRAFLLASVKNFLANEWDRRKTKKRGGNRTILSLDQARAEAWYVSSRDSSPEKLFERRWALTLLERVLQELLREYAGSNQQDLFNALKPALTGEGPMESYAEIGQRIGLREGAVKVAVHRLRRRYRELLRAEIAQTVVSPKEIDEEIRYLFQVFE